MNSLLKVDEPDGFPVGMICKVVSHPVESEIGVFVEIEEAARFDENVPGSMGPMDFYGQDCRIVANGSIGFEIFYALSWMRPATQEEIDQL